MKGAKILAMIYIKAKVHPLSTISSIPQRGHLSARREGLVQRASATLESLGSFSSASPSVKKRARVVLSPTRAFISALQCLQTQPKPSLMKWSISIRFRNADNGIADLRRRKLLSFNPPIRNPQSAYCLPKRRLSVVAAVNRTGTVTLPFSRATSTLTTSPT